MAVVPASYGLLDTYNQEPYVDTYVYSHDPTTSYCTNAAFIVGHDDTEFGATIYLRRVTEWWTCTKANPLTWNNKPDSVGWTSRSVSTNTGWYNRTITNLVQDYWIGRNFGTSPNYGFELRGPKSGTDYMRYFRTKNAASNHPYLVVEYQLPTPTPTRTLTRTPTPTPTVARICEDLVVSTTDDLDDLACDAAHCSLREAIICANDNPPLDHITFNISDTDPSFTGTWWIISPDSALPTFTDDRRLRVQRRLGRRGCRQRRHYR